MPIQTGGTGSGDFRGLESLQQQQNQNDDFGNILAQLIPGLLGFSVGGFPGAIAGAAFGGSQLDRDRIAEQNAFDRRNQENAIGSAFDVFSQVSADDRNLSLDDAFGILGGNGSQFGDAFLEDIGLGGVAPGDRLDFLGQSEASRHSAELSDINSSFGGQIGNLRGQIGGVDSTLGLLDEDDEFNRILQTGTGLAGLNEQSFFDNLSSDEFTRQGRLGLDPFDAGGIGDAQRSAGNQRFSNQFAAQTAAGEARRSLADANAGRRGEFIGGVNDDIGALISGRSASRLAENQLNVGEQGNIFNRAAGIQGALQGFQAQGLESALGLREDNRADILQTLNALGLLNSARNPDSGQFAFASQEQALLNLIAGQSDQESFNTAPVSLGI